MEVVYGKISRKKAPDFTMKAVKGDGSEFIDVKLSDYEGK